MKDSTNEESYSPDGSESVPRTSHKKRRTETLSKCPDAAPSTVMTDSSSPSQEELTSQSPGCSTSAPSKPNNPPSLTPVPLQHLENGTSIGGFYIYKDEGQEKILPMFATPVRYVKDHCYARPGTTKTSKKQLSFSHKSSPELQAPVSPHSVLDNEDYSMDWESDAHEKSDHDEDYIPQSNTDESEQYSSADECEHPDNIYKESDISELDQLKMIVFEENLKILMKFCFHCGSPVCTIDKNKSYKGACVSYTIHCHGGCTKTWSSQPENASLIIASSIIATGNTYSKVSSFAKALNLQFIGRTTYTTLERQTICPVIQEAWEAERQNVVEDMKNKNELILAGDARCDSVGYNAKYGSYTLMDTVPTSDNNSKKKIVSMELVQVSEVANSNHMEPEGLKRCLHQIKQDGLKPKALATDRHLMVTSIMKKDHKEINHQFDVWHFIKNIIKRLTTKAKLKSCSELTAWISSIKNHMWWCIQNCGGDVQRLREMWLSILHHIQNKHRWSGGQSKLFTRCAHKPLSNEAEEESAWLDPKSEAFKALSAIISDKRVLDALPNLTKFCHTGDLEVFHSALLKYCPKRTHFRYHTMKARLHLAALDWNSQTREEVKGEDGEVKQRLIFSKRQGKWVKRVHYKSTSENHIAPLLQKIIQCSRGGGQLPALKQPILPKHVAKQPKPQLRDFEKKSRFRKN